MSLMKIHRDAGDRNLGQTLLRLAQLAGAAHQFEQANALLDPHRDDALSSMKPNVQMFRKDAATVRTEVDQ